ncbi:hypothetical protein ACQ4PT_034019 [Festuca glaucescens]
MGESSGTAGNGREDGYGNDAFGNFAEGFQQNGNTRGGAFGVYHGGSGFSNNGYGQYRGGGAGYQNRRRFEFRAGRGDYRSRGGFNGAGRGRSGYGAYNRPEGRGYAGSENQQPILNQSLLQEAVGAVVEAVAAAAKEGHQMVLPQQQHVQVPVPRTEQRATQVAGQQNAAAAPARANDVGAEVPAVEVARQQQLAPNVQTSATVMTSNSGANIEVENSKMGKVTVVGGILTIPQIIAQLKWLVPSENYQWAVVHFRDNIFKVKFPSKVEVQRMKHFRTYQVPNTGCALSFDEWSIVDEPLYMLPEVWVQVSGIPKDVRDDYLALWALGTLFGKTKAVDMPYTRKHGVLRILVGCVDYTCIPTAMHVFIKRGFFKLGFVVETQEGLHTIDAVMEDAPGGHGDDEGADNGGSGENNGMEEDANTGKENNPNNTIVDSSNVVQGNGGPVNQLNDLMDIPAISFGSIPLLPTIHDSWADEVEAEERRRRLARSAPCGRDDAGHLARSRRSLPDLPWIFGSPEVIKKYAAAKRGSGHTG